MKTSRRFGLFLKCFWAAALISWAGAALFLIAKSLLAPAPGEWAVPLRAGPLQVRASVPALIRLATSPWVGPLLDGRRLHSRAGTLKLQWLARSRTLVVACEPCRLQHPALGAQPLPVSHFQLTVQRRFEALEGSWQAGKLVGSWRGRLVDGGLALEAALPLSPVADGYAVFSSAIEEVAVARIEGRFAFTAQISLPGGMLAVAPQVQGFQVSGLGTEAWAGARSSCTAGTEAIRLSSQSWLARAVIAAEDQRFYDHTGYDLAELTAALGQNQQPDAGALRGASTLSQQLAKLLVTGSERSPARKLRELLYAVEMERTLGKARILALYLAHAPWGSGLCGAQAAAMHYFGRGAHTLSAAQAAWLAAMLRNPPQQAQAWRDSGHIDLDRARQVAAGLRRLTRAERRRLDIDVQKLATHTPPPP